MRNDEDDIIIVRSSDGQPIADNVAAPPTKETPREEYVVYDGDEPDYDGTKESASGGGTGIGADATNKASASAQSRHLQQSAAATSQSAQSSASGASPFASYENEGNNRTHKTVAGNKKPVMRLRTLFGGDKVLWVVLIVLLIFSMLLTFSATVYKPGGSPTDKLITQVVFIVFGIGSLLLVHFIRYQFYGRMANAIFIFGFVLTVMALLIGPEGAEARRDLDIPLIGIRFQPFEILKIGLVMLLAKQLARRQKDMEDTPIMPSFKPSAWKDDAQEQIDIIRNRTIPLLVPIVLTCVVTYFAVGNSTTLIIAATCFVMLYIGRVRLADLGKIAGIAIVGAAILFAAGLGRSDTGSSRIASFKPDMFEKHARINSEGVEVYDYPETTNASGKVSPAESDQSITAKMSIASGGLFGKGPGMSTHRSNLAEAERDFAYAFIIEEYGAVGGMLILLLFLWLFFRSIEIFKKCGTAFPSLLVLGLGLMITMQAMIHMLVSVALFPVTGQQLPLISKGGSSLVFTLMALGMILGVSRQTDNKTLDTPKGESLFDNKK